MNCIAIAYEWLLAPARPSEPRNRQSHDFTLILTRCEMPHDAKGEQVKTAPITDYIYHAQFPPPGEHLQLTDVSGTLGLLWQSTEELAHRKAQAFERLLADAILWSLRDVEVNADGNHAILIQGPLIPKLRGRHLYRGFDPRVPIFSITFHLEWFRRIEAAHTTFAGMSGKDNPGIGKVYPPRTVDRATRSWVCCPLGADEPLQPLHFEVIANMWENCSGGEKPSDGKWDVWCEERIQKLASSSNIEAIGGGDTTRLPRAMTLAVQRARHLRRMEESAFKICMIGKAKFDPQLVNLDSVLRTMDKKGWRAACGDGCLIEDGKDQDLFFEAAVESGIRFNPGQAYKHIKENWHQESVRDAVESILSGAQNSLRS